MVQIREFVTAVAEEIENAEVDKGTEFDLVRKGRDDEGNEIEVERRSLIAYRPKDGQVAMLMARMGRHSSTQDKMAGIIDFFVEVLGREDHEYVVNRLLDREDPFGFGEVTDVMEYLMEEWAGRPTKPSRGSTPSRK